MNRRTWCAALALLSGLASQAAQAEVKVGVVLSLTGVGASLGIPEKNTVELLPPTLGGQAVRYIVLDDASDTVNATKHARRLIEACQKSNSIRTLALTTEEEGIPLAAGAWLGGQRSVLLMQSSGVGNTINLMGMPKTLRFPFLTLITMRGDWGEFNSWQYPMGQGTPKVLEAMGVLLYSVDNAAEVKATVDAAARSAFNGGQAVAVLLRQKLIGIKNFGKK